MRRFKPLSSLCAVATAVLFSSATMSAAATLLTVDVSNPNSVVIASTGASSDVDITTGLTIGPALIDFFSVDFDAAGIFAVDPFSTLLPEQPTPSSNANTLILQSIGDPIENDVVLGPSDGVTVFGYASLVFATTSSAFSGSATFDLSPIAAFLPSAGSTGDILAFDLDGGTPQVIGQYSVVPLPGAALLLLPVLAVFPLLRRRVGAD